MSFWSSIAPILGGVLGNVLLPGVGGAIGGALGGGISGASKHAAEVDKENKTRALAAETSRYSPWTKMQAGPIQYAGSGIDEIGGGALGGGITGYSMGDPIKKFMDGDKPSLFAGDKSPLVPQSPTPNYSLAGNTGQVGGASPWAPMAQMNYGARPTGPSMFTNNNPYKAS